MIKIKAVYVFDVYFEHKKILEKALNDIDEDKIISITSGENQYLIFYRE